MKSPHFELHDHVPPLEGGIVDAGLGHANDAAAPLDEVRRLSCFARDDAGAVIGGAVGRTWGECCELQQLWVDAGWRRRGIATQLLRLFEQRAVERGCATFYLARPFSFQAPAFYRKFGYQADGRRSVRFGRGHRQVSDDARPRRRRSPVYVRCSR